MLKSNKELLAELEAVLADQRYHRRAISNYCRCARRFLDYLEWQEIQVEDVTETLVLTYISHASGLLRKRHGQLGPYQHPIPRSGIDALLRLAQGQWPPAPKAACAAEAVRFAICNEYATWLHEARGLAAASIKVLIWEARHFLTWQLEQNGDNSLTSLRVDDIDRYMDLRAPKLTRKSLSAVANRLRSLLRHLHRVGRTAIDLSPHVIGPRIYAYEGVPSILERDEVAAVLRAVGKDRTSRGLRDHAILQLLATYGLRSSEICNLRLEDINWRGGVDPHSAHKDQGLFLPASDGAGRRSSACLFTRGAAGVRCPGNLHPHACALSQARDVGQLGATPATPGRCQAAGQERRPCLPTCTRGRDVARIGSTEGHR